jgi:hypothetical protein
MQPKQVFVLLVGALFVPGTDLFAQVRAGLNEVNVSTSVTASTLNGENTHTNVRLIGSYGHFVTDNVEVGPALRMWANAIVSGFGAYHFAPRGATMVPYAGGQIGHSWGVNNPFWSFGFFGGLKVFLPSGRAAVTLQPSWDHQAATSDLSNTRSSVDAYGVSAGISIFFD